MALHQNLWSWTVKVTGAMQFFFVQRDKARQTRRRPILSPALRFCILALLLWKLGHVGLRPLWAQSCPAVRVSQKYTVAYGTVSIGPLSAPIGTVVEARSPRGDVVGCRVIDAAGALRTTKIYGEESVAGVTVPGMRTGETIRFYLNGVLSETEPPLQWVDDWMVGSRHQVTLFAQSAPTFTPTATHTIMPATATATRTPTALPTVTTTNTPVPPTNTLTATATNTAIPPTPTATATSTPMPTATAPTVAPTHTPTSTHLPTVTPSETTPTPTHLSTSTPSLTPPDHTPTVTTTATPTDPATPTDTVTATPTDLPTVTPTHVAHTVTPTHTVTVATVTPTTTQTATPTASYTTTFTTPTPTATSTPPLPPTATPTPTPTATLSALPNLSLSRKAASSPKVDYFQRVDYTIILHNTGGPAQVQITDTLPMLLTYLPDTLSSTAGNATYSAGYNAVRWAGFVEHATTVTITFGMSGPSPIVAHDTIIENRVLIDDGVHEPFERSVTIIANPWPTPTPTTSPTVTHTPTVTPTPTATATSSPTDPPTATSVLTPTVTHTPTFTAAPTDIPTPTAIPSYTPTATPTAIHSPSPTATDIATVATAIPTTTPTATPIVVRIGPETGGTVTYTNTVGSRLTIDVPANAVTETIDLVLQIAPPSNMPLDFAFGGQSFTLDAFRNHTLLETYTFSQPITITIAYRENAISPIPETNLHLFLFDVRQKQWIDVKNTCTPESIYHRDAAENTLSIAVCHLTEFALFAVPQRLYLPYVQR